MTASMKPYSSASCAVTPAVAVRVGLDPFQGLAGVKGDTLGGASSSCNDLLSLQWHVLDA